MTYFEALKITFLAPFKLNKVAFTSLPDMSIKELFIEFISLVGLVLFSLFSPITAILVMYCRNKGNCLNSFKNKDLKV